MLLWSSELTGAFPLPTPPTLGQKRDTKKTDDETSPGKKRVTHGTKAGVKKLK